MQYTTGNRLKLTGISDIYTTVISYIPAGSKNITFNFVNCNDGDGITYPVVNIGSQVWMAENLKTTKYNNGTEHIPGITDNSEWSNTRTPAYSWYNNDIGNRDVYGALYNWFAVNTGSICPDGWHVAGDEAWTILTDYAGGQFLIQVQPMNSDFQLFPEDSDISVMAALAKLVINRAIGGLVPRPVQM